MTWPMTPGGETALRGHLLSSALAAPCIGQRCPLSGLWVTEPPMGLQWPLGEVYWVLSLGGHWVLASGAYWVVNEFLANSIH